MLTVFSSSL
jgi:hypothetical protein